MYKTPRHKQNERLIIQCWADEERRKKDHEGLMEGLGTALGFIIVVLFLLLMVKGCSTLAVADTLIDGYTAEKWANAIYIAEGGAKTRHPYGILATYKHTTARQACINTIKHKYSTWIAEGQKEAFMAYLGAKYCPVGASNDPGGLNKHWIHNVAYWLERV